MAIISVFVDLEKQQAQQQDRGGTLALCLVQCVRFPLNTELYCMVLTARWIKKPTVDDEEEDLRIDSQVRSEEAYPRYYGALSRQGLAGIQLTSTGRPAQISSQSLKPTSASMQAFLVAGPTATRNSPFLPQR